ncbi:MAG: cupin domain-containing protein [Alphaproteobacteria bacterium]|nr:cupin domain-containing protein [Alphaproteobacteria bacterium]
MLTLLRAIEAVYREAKDGPLAAASARIAGLKARDLRPGWSSRKPVASFVREAVDLGRRGPLAEIAEAFAAVEPLATWLQNPNYSVENMGPGYVDRYGYVELIGPGRPVESADLLVGLLMLGPEMHYPDHAHPAEEIYHVVAGHAEWWREGEGWHRKPPGSVIHHTPMTRHAMRTRDEPLLALYCWTGDVEVYATMTETSA